MVDALIWTVRSLRLRLISRKKINAMIANTTAPPTAPPAIAPTCDDELPLVIRVFVVGIVEPLSVPVLAVEAELPMTVTVGVFS